MNKNSQNLTEQMQTDTSQEPGTGIPASVPTGWKLVPVEPTDDMLIEGMEADCLGLPSIDDDNHVRSIWRAMLSSAPDAPPPPAAPQEPVAWMYEWNGRTHITTVDQRPIEHAYPHFNKSKPLYTTPQPTENLRCKSTQKRLATLWGYVKKEPDHFRDAAQMVSDRQPLTDEKLYDLYCEVMKGYYVSSLHYWRDTEAHKFARAIEAAVANQPPRQPMTDEQIIDLGPGQPDAVWSYEDQLYFARAIEAATANQPPLQPLTEDQIKAAVRHLYGSDAVAAMASSGDIDTTRAVEAAHGIGDTHK